MSGCIIGFMILQHPGCSPLKELASKSPGTLFFYTLKTSFLPSEHLLRGDRPCLDTLPRLRQHSQPISWLTWRVFFLPILSVSLSNPAVLLFCNGKSRNHFRKEASWFISLIKFKQRNLSTVHMMNGVPSPWPQWNLQWLLILGLSHPSHLQNHVAQR